MNDQTKLFFDGFEEDPRTVAMRGEVARLTELNERLRIENQRLLGDPGHDAPGKATSGRSGSRESQRAAWREYPKTGTKREFVLLTLLREYPVSLADEQIRDRLALRGQYLDIRSVNARRKELEEGGWVVKAPGKWFAPSHNHVSTWTLSATALEFLGRNS
jgi:hypothetical protein